MMSSLFSVFDPCSGIFNLPLNWLSTLLGLVFLPYMYWSSPTRWVLIWNKITSTLYLEFQVLLGVKFSNFILMFVSLFGFIVFNNFLGLFPYVFTSTSHLVVTLSLSLPLWLGYMVFGWINHTQHMFAHLVPNGTPSVLMPFMVLIETISNVIRPGTLAVRLCANMIAGHLLLSLMGGAGVGMGTVLTFFLVMSQILLLLLESAVAVIQSYVFAILSTLYASEVV
uniref:ATP synthase subunit a n=2 Tax=Neotrypaea TaxID=177237 RepID=A0A1S7J219_9EUCA|nr:ATP synthase F0 subunit 6 [Neotrypaea japonica]YP_009353721.1 ATP synthase F0 subunit 6 [Neotrypaea harmandi]AGE00859.1 ATP synthase F0 subunit 6 [Neotrypaea japonica]URF19373.1 ATP synthase F0 subunit 6 [Neotrypaea japonica]URF19386.1 ATP synthase F0 subunit 6 [Neotrypaea japonica]URF19399.1 ATP synthase F0 subunit 6 [Neotrypaea japonica]URF19412.1 ATP synthase F0 subunit 6 [Neotrypaea japonica]